MKRRMTPVNTTSEGCAFAVTTTMPLRAGITNLLCGGGHYPSTGVMEEYDDEEDTKTAECGR